MRVIHINEPTHVAEARREASLRAAALGFDDAGAGRVALVASELASNVLKHATRGEVLIGEYDDVSGSGIELIALDKGAGIADVLASSKDGVSTAGTAGNGLGAIGRQSQFMEVASWSRVGTAVLARISRQPHSLPVATPPWSCLCVPMPGEAVCGDACFAVASPAGTTFIVADGLGHGSEAAIAALEAIRLFRQHQSKSVPEILEYIHAGLRSTRGAAVAVARVVQDGSRVTFGGIGNISGAIVSSSGTRRMVSMSGTAGHVARRIQTFDYPCGDGIVVMNSDGLSSGWSLDRSPGLLVQHPILIAAILYRDFQRGRDDTSVMVARGAT